MLKALELSGFKSFADKTRFEFPEGITVVVGPNGSGKSNIVDAIKWVLGEQSAKSLRGKDMSDVIFKGSGGTNGRKPLNTAEASIVIDNSENRLGIDAPEVHITRRVYRSGEGEYLINRQPCRLKDVRDLCRGTGVGADAYSLIEQGKVDQMLQATAKDRRAIFEEAAGISRFKAKKVEAQRRLARVDQNLLRLSDIVDEVESRLRSVRAQATKARRYREHSNRLQQLRTHVGMTDWRKLTEQLEGIEAELDKFREECAKASSSVEVIDAKTLELEVDITEVDEAIRAGEDTSARNRERIATLESTIEHERSRCDDLEEQEVQIREQVAAMSTRTGDLLQRLYETREQLEKAESEYANLTAELTGKEQAAKDLNEQLQQLRSEHESQRNRYVEQMWTTATLGNQVSAFESQLATSKASADRARDRLRELKNECVSLAKDLQQLGEQKARLAEDTDARSAALEHVQRRLEEGRRLLSERREELSQLQLRYSGSTERLSVLQELERKYEGIGGGVQFVLEKAQLEPLGPFGDVCGLLADLVTADVEIAPLIDVALGSASQHLVLSENRLIECLRNETLQLDGPVGFVQRDTTPSEQPPRTLDLSRQPGVIGRADQMLRVAPEYQRLIHRVLGRTWFVDKLSTALSLNQSAVDGVRFVTLSGDLVESDGTIVIGSMRQTAGLVSRRSQLRALESKTIDLEQQIDIVQQEIDRRQAEVYQLDQSVQRLTEEHKQSYDALSESQIETNAAEHRLAETQKQRQAVQMELEAAETQTANTTEELESTRERLSVVESELAILEASQHRDSERIERLESQASERAQQLTTSQIELATSTQQLEGLRSQMSQFEERQRERDRANAEAHGQLYNCRQRRRESQRAILNATGEVADLYLRKESIRNETVGFIRQRKSLTQERTKLAGDAQSQRKAQRKYETKQHEAELSANEIRHERNTLAVRLQEDYGIDISTLELVQDEEEERKRTEIEDEIAELRRKINNIGAVNMDALNELDDLETRFTALSGQYEDLDQAKQSLERIIHKINADSRRLFATTLEAIRKNFQVLYRKAFGGGQADIVLEEGADILEGGIDIVATPPGKPQFNNSLLSGGEKALTAVSLLLAIFQYRPSPFCVLDEVDAPFDEANIGRFIDVLKEFLGWTKFVIVTHSKKTMTAASTLYGVTMQESGVSKQVSVKFEDVSEDGHISPDAIERQKADDADAA